MNRQPGHPRAHLRTAIAYGAVASTASVGAVLMSALAVHASDAVSAEQAMAAWVPPSVLIVLVATLGGAWWKSFTRRLDKMEQTLERVLERLPGFATTDALGRLGDRMDGRLTEAHSKLEVLKDRLSRRSRAESDE